MEKEFTDENQPVEIPEEETVPEQPVYTPRPKWQIIAAWVALVVFVLVIAGFYINVARGGL